jgi:AcrR family transcriptional regulator
MKKRLVKKSNSAPEARAAARIVAAARRHFFTHGFRTVTMDDLADELGMSKKTLYLCFAAKTDLLRAVILEKFREAESDLQQIMTNRSGGVLESLHRLLTCLQHHAGEIQPPFVRDIRREAPEIFDLVQSLRRQLIQRYFGTIFDEGRRAGIIRNDLSTRFMIEILLAATEAVVNPAKMEELGLTVEAGYLSVIHVILEGVLVRPAVADEARPRR